MTNKPASLKQAPVSAVPALEGLKVETLSVHVGVNIPGLSVTSLNYKDHGAAMTLIPVGVYVSISADKLKRRNAATVVIPWSNIHWVKILDDVQPAAISGAA